MAKVKGPFDDEIQFSVPIIDSAPIPTDVPIIEPDPTDEPEPKTPVTGVVVDCKLLNIRTKPRADADIICTIPCDGRVLIDEEMSTMTYYKVCSEFGAEGYCVKRYIDVLK